MQINICTNGQCEDIGKKHQGSHQASHTLRVILHRLIITKLTCLACISILPAYQTIVAPSVGVQKHRSLGKCHEFKYKQMPVMTYKKVNPVEILFNASNHAVTCKIFVSRNHLNFAGGKEFLSVLRDLSIDPHQAHLGLNMINSPII